MLFKTLDEAERQTDREKEIARARARARESKTLKTHPIPLVAGRSCYTAGTLVPRLTRSGAKSRQLRNALESCYSVTGNTSSINA